MKTVNDLPTWRPGVSDGETCECGTTVKGVVAVSVFDFRVVGCPECVKEFSNKGEV